MLKQKASDNKQNLHTQMETDYSVQCAVSTQRGQTTRYSVLSAPTTEQIPQRCTRS